MFDDAYTISEREEKYGPVIFLVVLFATTVTLFAFDLTVEPTNETPSAHLLAIQKGVTK